MGSKFQIRMNIVRRKYMHGYVILSQRHTYIYMSDTMNNFCPISIFFFFILLNLRSHYHSAEFKWCQMNFNHTFINVFFSDYSFFFISNCCLPRRKKSNLSVAALKVGNKSSNIWKGIKIRAIVKKPANHNEGHNGHYDCCALV